MVSDAQDLCTFVDASPTPFHACEAAIRRLEGSGFRRVLESSDEPLRPGGRYYFVRGGGSIIAIARGRSTQLRRRFRVVGAHTDSPNLRLKLKPNGRSQGFSQLSVEPYGGLLFSTWLDRDLSIAGRCFFRRGGRQIEERLVHFSRPLAKIPNLAIHLNRAVNTDGLLVNAQRHLSPIWGLASDATLESALCAELSEQESSLLGFDLMLHDTCAAALIGNQREFISAPRLDNLASCFMAVEALLRASSQDTDDVDLGIVLYDHEECGSRSAVGAHGTFLREVLTRCLEGRSDAFARSMTESLFISADMAHSIHPNYADAHEPNHHPIMGGGLVLKSNANQSYATNGLTASEVMLACAEADVPLQKFVTRSDTPCGSTIGSIVAANVGIQTVDLGAPMLSMHSCRELMGAGDVDLSIRAFRSLLLPS